MTPENKLKRILNHIDEIVYSYEFTPLSLFNRIQLIYIRTYEQCVRKSTGVDYNTEIAQLQTLIDRFRDLPNCIMGGNWDLLWIIGKLIKNNLIDIPEFLWNMAYEITSRYSSYLANTPYKIDLRQRFYPVGVGMIALHNQYDSLERFAWEEQIMFKLCDCERFISEATDKIYHPHMLSAGILHSVIAFADLSIKNKVYPYKSLQIRNLLMDASFDVNNSSITDILILRLYRNEPIADVVVNMSQNEIVNFLSELGSLSVIYENSPIFKEALNICEMFYPNLFHNLSAIPPQQLLGIAMGCINFNDSSHA